MSKVAAQFKAKGFKANAPIITPELKATPRTNCGYWVYLFARGYKAATGSIPKVAIKAGTGSCVSTYNPPQRLKNMRPTASRTVTYPEASGRSLHLSTLLSKLRSK